jgi:hypothetical protein
MKAKLDWLIASRWPVAAANPDLLSRVTLLSPTFGRLSTIGDLPKQRRQRYHIVNSPTRGFLYAGDLFTKQFYVALNVELNHLTTKRTQITRMPVFAF